jgi:hypothetical protein
VDWKQFFEEFQDHLAPKLDTYEQAIYLYAVRHSRLDERDEVVIGFKSARRRMAVGIGEAGKPMSEGSAYKKLQSLAEKGAIEILTTTHAGKRIRVKLPSEIAGVLPLALPKGAPKSLDDLDFFADPELRGTILAREDHRCFYCLSKLAADAWVIEHVRSRPAGTSSYRNVVAACRTCNNRKGAEQARDYLRTLYREGKLNDAELEHRLAAMGKLEAGELRPDVAPKHLV